MSGDLLREVEALMAEYAARLDDDNLESWLDLFVEDCLYKIIPRENVEQNLPLTYMLCENKNMLRDRVSSLRQANIYNIHMDRHLISGIRIIETDNDIHSVESSYAVFQTSQEGESSVFSVGKYQDKIVVEKGALMFKEKVVIADTASVPRLLSTPL